MKAATNQMLRTISKGTCGGLVDESQRTIQSDTQNAIADRFENQLALPRGKVQRLFGIVLLGHVHAVVEDEGLFAG